MNDRFFLDSGLLRDHVSEIREQQRTASRLHESVRRAMELGDPSLRTSYYPVLNKIETLEAYFRSMEEALDDIALNAEKLYHRIDTLIQDDRDKVSAQNARMML